MRGFPDQHHARIADASKQGFQVSSFNGTERLGRAGDYSRQSPLIGRDYLELTSRGRFSFGLPTLIAE
jgi:hypothetical protein